MLLSSDESKLTAWGIAVWTMLWAAATAEADTRGEAVDPKLLVDEPD